MLERMQGNADNAAVAGTLCHGIPWISGLLVGPSCPTAQTAAGRSLRAIEIAGIGDTWSGPAWRGHDGLQAANCEASPTGDPQEIHHDQIKLFQILTESGADFFLTAKSPVTRLPAEQSEPPHARTWALIRRDCRKGSECAYPFCRCEIPLTREDWTEKKSARKEAA